MPSAKLKSPIFSLLDAPPDHHLTRFRFEIKFGYVDTDFFKLDTILRTNNHPVHHHFETSTVHSIYFDDDRLTAFRENVEGIGTRLKVRLRWYDTPFPENRFFFEIKRRVNTVIAKERYALISHCSLAEMRYQDIIEHLLRTLPETPRELLRMRQTPVVLIRYRRRHYAARDHQIPIRITLDRNIEAFDQMGRQYPLTRFQAPLFDRVVLEAKAAVGTERKIPELLYPLKPRQTKFSKYALGCQQIGASAAVGAMMTA